MKEFIGTARNIGLRSQDSDFMPFVEVIIVVTEPVYNASLAGLEKTNAISDLRFVASHESLRKLAKHLEEMADDAEKMMEHVKR